MKKINTHMTLSDRIVIEQGLREGKSFKDIASIIQKDATTVSKEIRRAVNSDDCETDPVDCFYVDTCRETHFCISDCTSFCKYCSAVDCTQSCNRWKPKHCDKLKKSPYVCNACPDQIRCKLKKKYYHANPFKFLLLYKEVIRLGGFFCNNLFYFKTQKDLEALDR